MRFFLALLLCITFAYAGQGGDKPHIKKAKVTGVDQKAPVTRSEAASVFGKLRKAVTSARVAQLAPKSTIVAGNQAVTRDEVILEMSRILDASKKAIKFVPALVKYDPTVFKVGSPSSKSALVTLVSWGFVAPVGSLATGPKQNLSVAQFGDAVGYFLARISDLTHMPSPRWSPYLMPNEGG